MTRPVLSSDDLRAALPDVTSSITISGLRGDIEIIRDRLGVPHIFAGSAWDGFFGQGFAAAQDRLWHMDFDRFRGLGRTAELLGKDAVQADTQIRMLQLKKSAKADLEIASSDSREMLDAYTAGINGFIDSTQTLPIEYALLNTRPESWQADDCLVVFKIRHIFMGTFEHKLWRGILVAHLGAQKSATLLECYAEDGLLISPPGGTFPGKVIPHLEELKRHTDALNWLGETQQGSNSWVVTGEITKSGKPMLCGDSHRALDTPNVYYQNHVSCPDFDVIGFSFPGVPGFPHFGHNGHVAWCITHACADYQDLYIEQFDRGDPLRYKVQDHWESPEIQLDTIQVRDAEEVNIALVSTRHGPIITRNPESGFGIALKYTAIESAHNWADCLPKQLMAGSVKEMEGAMVDWVDPCNNFLFADVDGQVRYLTRGKVPTRPRENRWSPVPGWTGDFEWTGFVPFERMPRISDPKGGIIVTANNRIADVEEPDYIGVDYAPDYRARRVIDRLMELGGAGVDEMASVHAEKISVPALKYLELLRHATVQSTHATKAQEAFERWDGAMDKELIAPTIYSAFHDRLVATIICPHLESLQQVPLSGESRGSAAHVARLRWRLANAAFNNDVSMLPAGQNWSKVVAEALEHAVSDLQHRLGKNMDSWQWRRVHKTKPVHPLSRQFPHLSTLLDPPACAIHGDGDTPLQGGYARFKSFSATTVSVNRYIFTLDDLGASQWSVPLGASGHPESPHYSDQMNDWSNIRLSPMLYDRNSILGAAESRQQLKPE